MYLITVLNKDMLDTVRLIFFLLTKKEGLVIITLYLLLSIPGEIRISKISI